MIVTCPGCTTKFRVKDEMIPAGGAKMKCPKCSTMFAARRSDDPASPIPQPVMFEGALTAEPGALAAAPTHHAAREWDAQMSGDVPRPPRDPFYEANPAVAPPPPGQPAFVTASLMAAGPIRPAGPPPALAPAGEISDPFAHIDLTAPASQPLAGTGAGSLERVAAAPAAVASAAPAPVPAPVPAAAVPASTSEPPTSGSGVVIRDRSGKFTTFKYLPPARQYVAAHADPDGLEVSIAGAPYTPVKLSFAFSDVDFSRAAAPAIATTAVEAPRSGEVFPPPPKSIAELATGPRAPTLLDRVGLVIAATLCGLALLFALWQSELLPLDPQLTWLVSRATGLHSPLVLPELDPAQEAQRSLREAQAARDKGALGLAVLGYKRALLFKPGDHVIEKALAESYQQLGDLDRAAEMARAAGIKTPAASAPAANSKIPAATRPAGAKGSPRGELRKSPQLTGPKAAPAK